MSDKIYTSMSSARPLVDGLMQHVRLNLSQLHMDTCVDAGLLTEEFSKLIREIMNKDLEDGDPVFEEFINYMDHMEMRFYKEHPDCNCLELLYWQKLLQARSETESQKISEFVSSSYKNQAFYDLNWRMDPEYYRNFRKYLLDYTPMTRIILDIESEQKLLDFVKTPSKDYVPSDLFFSHLISMPDIELWLYDGERHAEVRFSVFPDYADRIEKSVAYLKEQNPEMMEYTGDAFAPMGVMDISLNGGANGLLFSFGVIPGLPVLLLDGMPYRYGEFDSIGALLFHNDGTFYDKCGRLLKTWYALQVTAFNPVYHSVYEHGSRTKCHRKYVAGQKAVKISYKVTEYEINTEKLLKLEEAFDYDAKDLCWYVPGYWRNQTKTDQPQCSYVAGYWRGSKSEKLKAAELESSIMNKIWTLDRPFVYERTRYATELGDITEQG